MISGIQISCFKILYVLLDDLKSSGLFLSHGPYSWYPWFVLPADSDMLTFLARWHHKTIHMSLSLNNFIYINLTEKPPGGRERTPTMRSCIDQVQTYLQRNWMTLDQYNDRYWLMVIINERLNSQTLQWPKLSVITVDVLWKTLPDDRSWFYIISFIVSSCIHQKSAHIYLFSNLPMKQTAQ